MYCVGIKSLAATQPQLFEGESAERITATARAELEMAELLLPGVGASSTIRRGSVRPDGTFGTFRTGGSLRGSGGSVVSSGFGYAGLSPRGGGTPLSRAPSLSSSRVSSGVASTIGGAPMNLLAGSRGSRARSPGTSFSHSSRFK